MSSWCSWDTYRVGPGTTDLVPAANDHLNVRTLARLLQVTAPGRAVAHNPYLTAE